jgi:hypothetical protein
LSVVQRRKPRWKVFKAVKNNWLLISLYVVKGLM